MLPTQNTTKEIRKGCSSAFDIPFAIICAILWREVRTLLMQLLMPHSTAAARDVAFNRRPWFANPASSGAESVRLE